MSTNCLCLLIIMLVAISMLLILTSVLFVIILRMKKENNDIISSLTFSVYQLKVNQGNSNDKLFNMDNDYKKALTIINKNIGSLSSGIDNVEKKLDNVIKTKNLLKEFRLPSPEESKAMRETILENINMEVLLSKNLKIARRDSTRSIIDNTLETYSDIEPEYVIKMCLAMIENFLETV